jgi:hypothetical protein
MSGAWALAAVVVASAALVVQVAEAQLPVLAELPEEPELLALAPPVQMPVLLLPVRVALVVAHPVVDSALLLDLLSRQSFSAAMARSSP